MLVFIPSYNSGKTIQSVIFNIRRVLPKTFILVIDDGSSDDTSSLAKSYGVHIISHGSNRGYGASQKTAFKFFTENGFDFAVMVHGDGQHNPFFIPQIINKLNCGCDLVLGSRMFYKSDALLGGMPLLKFFANMITSKLESFLSGVRISEFHSGFRGFSRRLIESIVKFSDDMSDDYLYDQQLIFLSAGLGFKICEIPVDTIYNDLSTHMDFRKGLKYISDSLIISIKFLLWRLKFVKDLRAVIKPGF